MKISYLEFTSMFMGKTIFERGKVIPKWEAYHKIDDFASVLQSRNPVFSTCDKIGWKDGKRSQRFM